MNSNFITAPRNSYVVEERQKEDRRICRQYQEWLIEEISNINMGNRDANLTEVEKIKSCMEDVKLRLKVFEMSSHGTGYRRYCDVSERKRLIDMVSQIIDNSDYIRKFNDYIRKVNEICSKLNLKYSELKQWIGLLENTKESNFYNYEL